MTIFVAERVPLDTGALFTLEKNEHQYKIIFTSHSLARMEKWQLTIEAVAKTLLDPEEVLLGHNKRFIAHRCFGQHVLRAVYEYQDFVPVLVTVYYPYKNRYYQGGISFEDQILPGS
ncbi:MAG: DUF4258 domain-containing protein [Desulfohalobiaceae bacterium]